MASSSSTKTSHLERTAAEPRDKSLHLVRLQRVDQVNNTTRLFRLAIPAAGPPIRFLPGQWLDVFVPGIPKPGGFTITSPPSEARPTPAAAAAAADPKRSDEGGSTNSTELGFLELAIQKSPGNPPAAWLWQDPASSLVGQELEVRVGGSFVWPPPGLNIRTLKRVVFIAGGVGINPLISMLSDIAGKGGSPAGFEVRFLYSLRDPGPGLRTAREMLFLERIVEIFGSGKVKGELKLFLTGAGEEGVVECGYGGTVTFQGRRMTKEDLEEAVGGSSAERRFSVAYVCGMPTMTDEFVGLLTHKEGLNMAPHTVLCEKWW